MALSGTLKGALRRWLQRGEEALGEEVEGGAVKDPFCQRGQTLTHLLACLGQQGDTVQHGGVANQAQTSQWCACGD